MVIWKSTFDLTDHFSLELPTGSKILKVGLDPNGAPAFWYLVPNPEAQKVLRNFRVYGTGHSIMEGESYVGTFDMSPFVWHVFEGVK